MDYGILGWIMPGKDPGGIIVTILIGIAGGVVGGFIGNRIGFGGSGNIVNTLIATAGAVLLLWIYRLIQKRST